MFETFNKKQHLIIARTVELRDTCPSEYRYLTARNTDSLFAVPFEDESTFSGYIGMTIPIPTMTPLSCWIPLPITLQMR